LNNVFTASKKLELSPCKDNLIVVDDDGNDSKDSPSNSSYDWKLDYTNAGVDFTDFCGCKRS